MGKAAKSMISDSKLENSEVTDVQNCVILMVGLSQHGKSSTLNSLLGKDYFLVGNNGLSKTKDVVVRMHPEVNNLFFIDTPGINETDPDVTKEKIMMKISKCTKDLKNPYLIFFCRRFTHPQTQDYIDFKKLSNSLREKWPTVPMFLIYTRCCDIPDMGILGDSHVKEDIRKYQAKPFSYKKKIAKFLAFRDLRIRQAEEDGFHKVFFIENDMDEDGKLPDDSDCWDPLIRVLQELSPLKNKCISNPNERNLNK